jgi:signal transduction histidine kinase
VRSYPGVTIGALGEPRHIQVLHRQRDDAADPPAYSEVVNRVLRAAPVSDTWRAPLRAAGRGLIEVLVSPDPPWTSSSPARRRAAAAVTALGTALVLLAILDLVLSMHGIPGPGKSPAPGLTTGGGALKTHVGSVSATDLEFSPLLLGLGTLLLAWRYPLLAWRIGYLGALFLPLQTPAIPLLWRSAGWESVLLVLLVVVFCLAGWVHSRPALWWMCALMPLPVVLWLEPDWPLVGVASVALAAVTVALDATGASRRARRALVVQSGRTELEEARRALLEERTRIARELHDVVAHHLSLIAVQTETARYRLGDLSDTALAEFSSVSGQAREALTDMRKLLGVLRKDGPAERAPQPGLDDVLDLVAASRRAGIGIELSMPGDARPVPPRVGLCAYRIVQEALSNASRHAPGSLVSVSLEADDRALRLQVANGPAISSAPPEGPRRTGHGLAGMHERVALLDGSLSAAPAPDGGFVVAAVLPLNEALPSQAR